MDEENNAFIPANERREIENLYKLATKGPIRQACPLRCRIRLHRWSTWWTVHHGDMTQGGERVGIYEEQKRFCLLCNKVTFRQEQT